MVFSPQKQWQTCRKILQYRTWGVYCERWLIPIRADFSYRLKLVWSKMLPAVWRFHIWFHPIGCGFIVAVIIENSCDSAVSLCWYISDSARHSPALPRVYPSCHGNTLQSHRPKYPKMRIISWQDASVYVLYCTLHVSCVVNRKKYKYDDYFSKVEQLDSWVLRCHTHRPLFFTCKPHLNCTLKQFETYSLEKKNKKTFASVHS